MAWCIQIKASGNFLITDELPIQIHIKRVIEGIHKKAQQGTKLKEHDSKRCCFYLFLFQYNDKNKYLLQSVILSLIVSQAFFEIKMKYLVEYVYTLKTHKEIR